MDSSRENRKTPDSEPMEMELAMLWFSQIKIIDTEMTEMPMTEIRVNVALTGYRY